MNAPNAVSRVAVIGAGIFGVSTALHLARLGAQVTLVTAGNPASGASGRSLSWLNSSRRRSAEYHRLRMIGIDRYRTLAAQHPHADWLRFDGGLTWDADDDHNEIAAAFAHERDIGYEARLLMPAAVAAVTPGVDTRTITRQGAIFNAGEGWVDLPSLIDVLLAEFLALGGRLVAEAGLASVDIGDARVSGITVGNTTHIDADAVLVAAGAAVPSIVAKAGIRIEDATPIALLVKTRPAGLALRAVLNTPLVAVRPTPTGALVLDSAWSEREVVTRADGSYAVAASTVEGLLAAASAVLDGNPRLELESYGVGPKPIPKGGEPVFGRLDAIGGYFVAFSHSGATLGLIAGELLAHEMLTDQPHPLLATFRPGRFG